MDSEYLEALEGIRKEAAIQRENNDEIMMNHLKHSAQVIAGIESMRDDTELLEAIIGSPLS